MKSQILATLSFGIGLGRASAHIIRQNLVIASGFAAPFAPLGLVWG